MESVNVKLIIDQLHGAGLSLTVKPDGLLSVSPSTNLTDDLRTLIREHKPVLIDWLRATAPAANDPATDTTAQPGTQNPDLLPAPRLVANEAPHPPTPPKPVKHVDQNWKPLALAYHAHHFKCHVCKAAGRGSNYGPRCGVGASLWTGYQNAAT